MTAREFFHRLSNHLHVTGGECATVHYAGQTIAQRYTFGERRRDVYKFVGRSGALIGPGGPDTHFGAEATVPLDMIEHLAVWQR